MLWGLFTAIWPLLFGSMWGLYRTTEANNSPRSTTAGPPCEPTNNQSDLNSFLWTIKTEPPSYFFGTIHVPYTRVWDFIPENTKEAFQRAEKVFFELDLTDPSTISALANCQLLPQGESLATILPRDLYRRLKRHLEYVKLKMPEWMTSDQRGHGLYADYLFNAITGNWERKRPVWVMLMVNSLTESDIRSRAIPVLDLYLAQEAERMKKETGAVEKVEEHCVPLNELNFSQVVFALNQTLWQHETYRTGVGSIPYTTDDLIKHYNCGNLNTIIFSHDTTQVPNLVNFSLPPPDLFTAQRIDDYFRQELIYKRNQRMADRVVQLLRAHPNKSFFFAFGAGHFLGNNTVIDHLKERGYDIEHTPAGQDVFLGERWKKRRRKFQQAAGVDGAGHLSESGFSRDQDGDTFPERRRHRHRHNNRQRGRRKGRRKGGPTTDSYRLKQPQFNDLWVRLESTSFGPETYFRRQGLVEPSTEPPSAKYAKYSSASFLQTSICLLLVSFLVTMGIRPVVMER